MFSQYKVYFLVLAFVVSFGGGFYFNNVLWSLKWEKAQKESIEGSLKGEKETRKKETVATNILITESKNAKDQESQIRSLTNANNTLLSELRESKLRYERLSKNTTATRVCQTDYGILYSELLNNCGESLVRMASEADRNRSEGSSCAEIYEKVRESYGSDGIQ